MVSLYFLTSFEFESNELNSTSDKTSILLIGARIIVAASGVGRPFSSKAETRASPIPSDVKTSVVS